MESQGPQKRNRDSIPGARATVARPRLLLVAYHFGPGCATGGFRWNAMAKALACRGWALDVITLATPPIGDRRQALSYQFANGIRVFPVARPTWPSELLALAAHLKRRIEASSRRLMPRSSPDHAPLSDAREPTWNSRGLYEHIMANVDGITDYFEERIWVGRALRVGRALARKPVYSAVIVSSPPYLSQLVGARIGREFGIPFLPDFRDPWIFGHPRECRNTEIERLIGSYYEPRIVRQAHTLICNTTQAGEALAKAHPDRPGQIIALPNGYDRLRDVARPDETCFRIVFAGWIYHFMDPRPLFDACARLQCRQRLSNPMMRVEFMGTNEMFGTRPLREVAAAHGIGEVFVQHPRGSREEALRLQQKAAVLVAFDCPHPFAVPSKFYDYAQLRGSMLLIGNREGALADAAAQLGLRVHTPGDTEGMDATLDAALARWHDGRYPHPLDPEGLFDRKHQSERLDRLLSAILRDDGSIPGPVALGGSSSDPTA